MKLGAQAPLGSQAMPTPPGRGPPNLPGSDVDEQMGLLAARQALQVALLRRVCVDATGRRLVSRDAVRHLLYCRPHGMLRGKLARLVYATLLERFPVRFGTRVASFEQDERQV
jgi:hypothetical protein